MPIDRFEVANIKNWGNLVKTWATGVNKLGDGQSYPIPSGPTRFQQFKAQLDSAQVGKSIPDYVTDVMFVQTNKEVLLFRLPPKDLVEDSELTLQGGAPYPLQPFYATLFGPGPIPSNLDLHAMRVGDYTLTLCT